MITVTDVLIGTLIKIIKMVNFMFILPQLILKIGILFYVPPICYL